MNVRSHILAFSICCVSLIAFALVAPNKLSAQNSMPGRINSVIIPDTLLSPGSSVTTAAVAKRTPATLSLCANPNPFHITQEFTVRFDPSLSGAPARAAIYDDLGREVAVVFDGRLGKEQTTFQWMPKDVAIGTYRILLSSGSHAIEEQIVYVK